MLLILRQLMLLASFTISMMIYMRASTEEIPENSKTFLTMAYLTVLSAFAGICESAELYDHLFPKEDAIEKTEDDKTRRDKQCMSLKKTATIVMSLSPVLYAHKLQGDELAKAIGLDDQISGLILASPALIKFFTVAIPHIQHTLEGTRERFSVSVTNNKTNDKLQNSLPSLKYWFMLALLIYLHLPEGLLIAAPIRNNLLKQLAGYGFALAESVPHLNQLEQLPRNIAGMISSEKQPSITSVMLRMSAGIAGGLGSASEALLAAFAGTRSKATAWIAPLVEFILGFSETQQHLIPSIHKLIVKNDKRTNESKTKIHIAKKSMFKQLTDHGLHNPIKHHSHKKNHR